MVIYCSKIKQIINMAILFGGREGSRRCRGIGFANYVPGLSDINLFIHIYWGSVMCQYYLFMALTNKQKNLSPLKLILYEHFKMVGWNGVSDLRKHMWSRIWPNQECGPYKYYTVSKWNFSGGRKSTISSGIFLLTKWGNWKKSLLNKLSV